MSLVLLETSGAGAGTHDKVQRTMSSSSVKKATTSTKLHEGSLPRCQGTTNPRPHLGTSSHCYEGLNLQGTCSLVSAPSTSSTSSTTKSTTSSTSPAKTTTASTSSAKTTTAKGSPAAFGAGARLTNTERPLFQ